MSQASLKDRLAAYLRNHHGWIASGELQRIVAQHTTYSPQNVGRRLRELVEEGTLEVQYRKNHAWYRAASNPQTMEQWFDELPTKGLTPAVNL